MVQASTLFLAAFVIAPVIAVPLTVEESNESFTRSVDEITDLELRDPRFSFKGLVRGATRLVKKVMPAVKTLAPMAASIVLRDEDGTIYVRDLDESELFERELIDIEELHAREPFSFSSFASGVSGLAKKAGGAVGQARRVVNTASRVSNQVSGIAKGFGLREFDEDEFEAREFEIDELD